MMMMKKMTLLALVAALVVALTAGTAVAKPDKAKGPKKEKSVTYLFQGTVAEVTQAATDPVTGLPITDPNTGEPLEDGIVVDVKQGNKAAKAKGFIGQQVSFAVDSATKIERNDKEATLAELQPGDKVMVQVKAPASATSFTAKNISAEGPEPAPDPAQ